MRLEAEGIGPGDVVVGASGLRQVPGRCRVGFTQVYGAPGVSACAVLSR